MELIFVKRHTVQNELTFRQMMDGISALVAVLTPDGTVDVVNRQMLDYFGKSLEELKKWSSTDAVHPEELPGALTVLGRSLTGSSRRAIWMVVWCAGTR
jgi:PAS domain S-box-containing protein